VSSVVLAISGSLRKPSFTEKMLDLCIEGMGEGLEVHKFYPHKMDIKPCDSCFSCWGKKRPGVCAKQDDFAQILDVYKRADYFLLAAPLYVFDFPATVKNVLDRCFIVLEPAQVPTASGATTHPKRFGRHPKTVLISSCGFPEIENFDVLRRHFRTICEHTEWQHSGELLISAAGLANAPKLFDAKYELLRQAGAELVKGAVSASTAAAIAAPVMKPEYYRQITTLSFEGGLLNQAKIAGIAMKAMSDRPEESATEEAGSDV
jgi:NAD(P)H-dependent FMN reductase